MRPLVRWHIIIKRMCNYVEPNNYVMNEDHFLKSFPGPAITNDNDDDEDGDEDQDENEDEDMNDDGGNGDADDGDEDENTDENKYAFFCGRRMTNYCFITTQNIPSKSANAPAVRECGGQRV